MAMLLWHRHFLSPYIFAIYKLSAIFAKKRMSKISNTYSVKCIEKQYGTGDLPVLVYCTDNKSYICKYMRSSSSAYKLACELLGASFAKEWNINTPNLSFVYINNKHWAYINTPHFIGAPCIGYEVIENVVDVTPFSVHDIDVNCDLLKQLLLIALFDFWIANEDRTCNNANLLFDVVNKKIISIDYGGIFNTATFDYDLMQLTSTDSILCADIFRRICSKMQPSKIIEYALGLRPFYDKCIRNCKKRCNVIVNDIPCEWKVPADSVNRQVDYILTDSWVEQTWMNFIECVKEQIKYE